MTGAMEPILKSILWGIVKPFALTALMMLPAFFLAWRFVKAKKRYKSESEEPFTGLPHRPAGESLRVKIQDLDDKLTEELLLMIIYPIVLALLVATNPIYQTWPSLTVFVLVSLVVAVWSGRRAMKSLRQRWNCSLGFEGERVVGEELNQLMLSGYRVFHDLPFESFNIDHVVVGPPGVYAIETKARRKPVRDRGKKEYHVRFDGAALYWPKHLAQKHSDGPSKQRSEKQIEWRETKEIAQTALNARTLGEWLTSATGDKVGVNAVLVIPGWYVDRTGKGLVNVLNEKEVQHSFPARPANPLPPDQIQRIVHQLSERCRLPKE